MSAKPYCVVTICAEPPDARCQPGQWCEYRVVTSSGSHYVRGFAPGSIEAVTKLAQQRLAHMQRIEKPNAKSAQDAEWRNFTRSQLRARRSAQHDDELAQYIEEIDE